MKQHNSTGSINLPYIDSLRGVAILMVIMVHVSIDLPAENNLTYALIGYGQFGVQLFFLVSAVTLSVSLDASQYKPGYLKAFYIRRYFRIAPMYYVGILLYLLYYYSLYLIFNRSQIFAGLLSQYSISNIIANVLLIHGLYPPANNNIVAGGWSIGTEVAFYLIFPFLYPLMSKGFERIGNRFKALIYILSIGIVVLCIQMLTATLGIHVENNGFFYFSLLNQFPVFLTGIFFHLAMKKEAFRFKNYLVIICFILISAVTIICFSLHLNFTLTPLLSSVSFIFLYILFKQNVSLNIKPLRRIGQLSYSIYIFHFIISQVVSLVVNRHVLYSQHAYLSFFINYFLVLFISAGIALISSPLIEVRGIRLGKRLSAIK